MFTGGLLNLPGNPIPPFGFILKHCVGDGDTTTADGRSVAVRLRNNTGTIMKVKHYGGVETHADDSGSDAAPGVIESFFAHFATGSIEYAGPGDTSKLTVPAGEFGAVVMSPDRLRTILNTGTHYIFDQVLDRFGGDDGPIIKDPTAREFNVRTLECEYNTLNAVTGGVSFANSARDTSRAIYDCLVNENTLVNLTVRIQQMVNNGLIAGSVADKAVEGLAVLRNTQRWLKIGQITVDAVDTIWAFLGAVPTTVEHTASKPTQDAEGRTVFDRCVMLVGLKWRVDENCQNASYAQTDQPTGGGGATGLPLGKMFRTTTGNAFFVNLETAERQRIPDGGTYLCLARYYAVDWNADPHTYQSEYPALGPDATCDPSKPAADLSPGHLGALTLDRVLRQADGTAWIIHPDDTREHILSGAEFNCWVSPPYAANIEFDVWDQVSPDVIALYPVAGYTSSNCGDPTTRCIRADHGKTRCGTRSAPRRSDMRSGASKRPRSGSSFPDGEKTATSAVFERSCSPSAGATRSSCRQPRTGRRACDRSAPLPTPEVRLTVEPERNPRPPAETLHVSFPPATSVSSAYIMCAFWCTPCVRPTTLDNDGCAGPGATSRF